MLITIWKNNSEDQDPGSRNPDHQKCQSHNPERSNPKKGMLEKEVPPHSFRIPSWPFEEGLMPERETSESRNSLHLCLEAASHWVLVSVQGSLESLRWPCTRARRDHSTLLFHCALSTQPFRPFSGNFTDLSPEQPEHTLTGLSAHLSQPFSFCEGGTLSAFMTTVFPDCVLLDIWLWGFLAIEDFDFGVLAFSSVSFLVVTQAHCRWTQPWRC